MHPLPPYRAGLVGQMNDKASAVCSGSGHVNASGKAPASGEGGNGSFDEFVSKALRRAFQLGQTYWQQADSEYLSQNRRADETYARFVALVDETRTALAKCGGTP